MMRRLKRGELTSWSSEEFRLPKGTKRIYALANWESLKNETLKAAIEAKERVTRCRSYRRMSPGLKVVFNPGEWSLSSDELC